MRCANGARPVNRALTLSFGAAPARAYARPNDGWDESMPKTMAQWVGIVVTSIVVLGCDADVIYAVPLGIFAGALATLFVALDDQRRLVKARSQ